MVVDSVELLLEFESELKLDAEFDALNPKVLSEFALPNREETKLVGAEFMEVKPKLVSELFAIPKLLGFPKPDSEFPLFVIPNWEETPKLVGFPKPESD